LQNETLEPTAGPWPGVGPVIKNQSSFRRQPSRAQQPQLMRPRQPWPSGWQWITTFIGVFAEQWAGTVAYRRVDARSRQRGAGGPSWLGRREPTVTRIKFSGDKKPSNLAIVLIGFSAKWHWCLRIRGREAIFSESNMQVLRCRWTSHASSEG